MWTVIFETSALEKETQKRLQKGEFTDSEKVVIQTWIRQMTFDGPNSVESNPLWNDHELEREWKGYRSSSFSNRGRIIYKIENDKIIIKIARITKTHDYSKNNKEK